MRRERKGLLRPSFCAVAAAISTADMDLVAVLRARYEAMSEKLFARAIRTLGKRIRDHAKNFDFEKAARARDRLAALGKRVFGFEPAAE